ncbi:cytochrome c [Sphingobium aquiterrae]|uniref:c-type cytochrome n=1 Tax=Sphingobium aquiterrae TaxID=2038656 RepID=UPI0030179EA0
MQSSPIILALGIGAAAITPLWAQTGPASPAAAGTEAAAEAGAEAFRRHCAACHGPEGEGAAGPQLVPLPIPAADVRAVVREGSGQMPPIAREQLPDATLAAVIGFLAKPR